MSAPEQKPEVSAFDLSSLDGLVEAQEQGTNVDISHPKTGEPLGIVIRVAGPDSARVKKARAAIVNERTEQKLRKITGERLEEEGARLTAATIIGWSGIVENGKPVEYSDLNARKLMSKYPFIREQIDNAASDRANFIKS